MRRQSFERRIVCKNNDLSGVSLREGTGNAFGVSGNFDAGNREDAEMSRGAGLAWFEPEQAVLLAPVQRDIGSHEGLGRQVGGLSPLEYGGHDRR